MQKLNGVTIHNSTLLPNIEDVVEGFARHACYTIFDIFMGYDNQTLALESHDMTSFLVPGFGLLRLTSLPMGATNAMAKFQACMMFILQEEIPGVAGVFIDDMPIKGAKTRYEQGDGFKVLPENLGIRRPLGSHGISPQATASGQRSAPPRECLYVPGETARSEQGVEDLQLARMLRHARSMRFLGYLQSHASMDLRLLLGGLAPDNAPQARSAMAIGAQGARRDATAEGAGVKRPLPGALGLRDQGGNHPGCGFIPHCHWIRALPAGSGGEAEAVVEVDVKYIQGMLNSPELVQNAIVGCWAEEILCYPFKLQHVRVANHAAPDGLSHRRHAPEDTESDESDREQPGQSQIMAASRLDGWVNPGRTICIGMMVVSKTWEPELEEVWQWLGGMTRPSGISKDEAWALAKKVKGFLAIEGQLWRQRIDGQHQLIMLKECQLQTISQAHDELGHKGIWSTVQQLQLQVWWPRMEEDVVAFVQSCP
ncbi:hypothetical protein OPQ81_010625 [Rhizoctonia solani]|nr:hypothetical protein OPQ81_010625 [Rhizoctonia solani]